MDLENGETFWKVEREAACDQNKHIVLYEGPAKDVNPTNKSDKTMRYFMVNQGQKIFVLKVTSSYKMCIFKA